MGVDESPAPKVARLHRSIDEARDLVAAWRSSGLAKEAWCRAQGLRRSLLWSCLHRVERADRPAELAGGFISVRPPAHGRPGFPAQNVEKAVMVLELPHGVRVTGLSPTVLAKIIRLLGSGE